MGGVKEGVWSEMGEGKLGLGTFQQGTLYAFQKKSCNGLVKTGNVDAGGGIAHTKEALAVNNKSHGGRSFCKTWQWRQESLNTGERRNLSFHKPQSKEN